MNAKLAILITCLIVTVFLTGCKVGGSDVSSFDIGGSSGGDSTVASLPYDGGSGDGSSGGATNPEPATLGLLGSGLLAYVLLRRKRSKK